LFWPLPLPIPQPDPLPGPFPAPGQPDLESLAPCTASGAVVVDPGPDDAGGWEVDEPALGGSPEGDAVGDDAGASPEAGTPDEPCPLPPAEDSDDGPVGSVIGGDEAAGGVALLSLSFDPAGGRWPGFGLGSGFGLLPASGAGVGLGFTLGALAIGLSFAASLPRGVTARSAFFSAARSFAAALLP
jgi:hypothetical protein